MKSVSFALCIVWIFSVPTFSAGKESGVLLGLRSLSESHGPAYRTLWITAEDGAAELVAEGWDLLVPRKTGFWRVGIERLMDEQWSEDMLWAVPAGEEPNFPPLSYDEGCEGGYWQQILFAGNDYISVELESSGYCEGAAHPWDASWLEVASLDDLQKEQGCIPISACFGEGANAQLLVAAEQYCAGLSEEEREMLEDQPGDCSWGLIRRRGQWVLRGRLQYSSEACRGHFADFDVPIKPPKKLVSHDMLHPSWKQVKAKVPGAVDACSSPAKDLLVVFTKETLTVHPVTGDVIGAASLTVELLSGEAAVMIQWAEGKHVARWTGEISGHLWSD